MNSKCDSCNSSFARESLHPTSGDWWMCDACMDKIFRDNQRERGLVVVDRSVDWDPPRQTKLQRTRRIIDITTKVCGWIFILGMLAIVIMGLWDIPPFDGQTIVMPKGTR